MEKKLSELAIGQQGSVKKVVAETKLKRRLFDMGLTPGAQVLLKKRAPLGDPIELTVRGYELSIRKADAEYIILEMEK